MPMVRIVRFTSPSAESETQWSSTDMTGHGHVSPCLSGTFFQPFSWW